MTDAAKAARRAYQKQWRQEHREQINAYSRQWRRDHPDKVKEQIERHWEKVAQETAPAREGVQHED